MENKKSKRYSECARNLIELVLDSSGHDMIYGELAQRDSQLKNMSPENFFQEYVPAKLALGCVFWAGCCEMHRIDSKDVRNIYFKEVMSFFESPRSLLNATRFSESLYASNADKENSPVLGIMVHLFHKLQLLTLDAAAEGAEQSVSQGFQFMMGVSEALKTAFENQFDDFILNSNKDSRAERP